MSGYRPKSSRVYYWHVSSTKGHLTPELVVEMNLGSEIKGHNCWRMSALNNKTSANMMFAEVLFCAGCFKDAPSYSVTTLKPVVCVCCTTGVAGGSRVGLVNEASKVQLRPGAR